MKRHEYILRSDAVRANCIAELRGLSLDKPVRVMIERYRKRRTLAQNDGYAVWIDEAAEKLSPITGDTIEELKSDLRDYVRENFVPPKARSIGGLRSTRHCSVEEMSEVMERFAHWMAQEWGIELSPLAPVWVGRGGDVD